MKNYFKKVLAIVLSIMTMMVFSMPAFADTEPQTENGATSVELQVVNNFIMFKPTAAKLITAEDGAMTLELTYTSTSYDKAYVGTASEAVFKAEETKQIEKSAEGVYSIPVEKVGEAFPVAFRSVKYEGYYDRTFTIDLEAKTLTTDNPGTPLVPERLAKDWDDVVSVESSLETFEVEKTKVVVNDDGTASITLMAGNPSCSFPKIALVDQTLSVEEKEAAAIVGVATGDENNNYVYEFTVPVEQLGTPINISHYQNENGAEEWHNWSAQQTITINSSEVVNQLIEKIQIQKNNEYTDTYIAAAKRCWDGLSDEAKEEDDGYFSEDTGDASMDDPLNTAPDKEKELLVVSFGTSFNDSRVATIGAVEKALAAQYGDEYAVRRAFTAQIIINHVAARDGEQIDNVEQAMDKAVEAGVKEMLVQPTHLMSGAEYDELKEAIDQYADKIQITYAKPLLNSNTDKEAVAKAVVAATVKDSDYASREAADADKVAFVYMGHGTSHEANATYTYMQETMDKLGYDNCFIGTVEGLPEPTALPEVKKAVEAKGYTKVILRPLMVVAGDHANNDMAADEEGSWYYAFVNGGEFEVEGKDEPVNIGAGFGADNVICQIKGLGEIPEVQNLYVLHSSSSVLEKEKTIAEQEETISELEVTIAELKLNIVDLAPVAKTTYNSATLSWTANDDAEGYLVNGEDNGANTTAKFTGLSTGKAYTYKVQAYANCNGKTVYSKEYTVTVKPNLKKTTAKVTNVKTKAAKVTWTKIAGAKKYQVSISTTKKGTKVVKTTTAKSFKKTGLKKGKTYYVKVRGVAANGAKGPWSVVKSVKIKK